MNTLLNLSNIRTIYRIVKDIQKDLKKANLSSRYLSVKVDFRKCLEYVQGIGYYGYDQDQIMINTYNFLASLRDQINDVIDAKMQLTLSQFKDIYRLNKELTSLVDQIHCLRPHYNFRKYTFKELMTNAYSLKWSHENLLYQLNDKIYHAEQQLRSIQREEARLEREAKEALIRMQPPAVGYKFTIAQIRLINQKTELGNYTLKEFMSICLDRDIDDIYKVLEVIESLNNGYLTIETLENNEYFYHEDRYYDNDAYCLTLEGDIADSDDCSWCEKSEEYTSDPVILRDGREEITIARSVAEREYYQCSWDSDIFFNYNAIEYYGYYLNDDNEVTEEPPYEEYVREYHSNTTPKFVIFDDNNPYRIGFEIEKEDVSVKESINIDDFEYETDNNWRKEEDGSLSNYSGYELVSPCFSLDPQEIREYIENNDILCDHINADYSDNCGGHINLSKKGLTGEEFYETIKGYTPLIHALNYNRLDEHYCTPASVDKLKADKRKYQSIAIWDNRIELRIFSAVESVDQLIWRAELMRLICDNPTDCFKTAFYNCHTVLKQHLYDGYCKNYFYDYDHFDLFIEEIIEQCKKHENIDLTNA